MMQISVEEYISPRRDFTQSLASSIERQPELELLSLTLPAEEAVLRQARADRFQKRYECIPVVCKNLLLPSCIPPTTWNLDCESTEHMQRGSTNPVFADINSNEIEFFSIAFPSSLAKCMGMQPAMRQQANLSTVPQSGAV